MNKQIIEDIKKSLDKLAQSTMIDDCDLGDIGNDIGAVIGDYLQDEKYVTGYDKECFISGIKHGISLKDGTH